LAEHALCQEGWPRLRSKLMLKLQPRLLNELPAVGQAKLFREPANRHRTAEGNCRNSPSLGGPVLR
jgi:hypothetical protein